ncbi:DMT family protein [bacterium]|nr:DMT family protein [bacterium]
MFYKIAFPIILLLFSNIFMTFAWYGHLKYKQTSIILVILISWGIAFFEYCLQVPANRIGHSYYSAAELKIVQEVITLVVFSVFSIFFLKENLKWNHIAAFCCILMAILFIFIPKK